MSPNRTVLAQANAKAASRDRENKGSSPGGEIRTNPKQWRRASEGGERAMEGDQEGCIQPRSTDLHRTIPPSL